MSRLVAASIAAGLMAAVPASAEETISLRDVGWSHVGGRLAEERSGWMVKEQFTLTGGVPAKFDPSGTYRVEAMYMQLFAQPLPQGDNRALNDATFETTVDGGWLSYLQRVADSYALPRWQNVCRWGDGTSF